MFAASVSARKVHCCLLALVLFILIFLSLPLLFIYLANLRHEESHERSSNHTKPAAGRTNNSSQPLLSASGNSQSTAIVFAPTLSPPAAVDSVTVNCTQYAIQYNLSRADENFHCPIGTFPCQSCPEICIEQWRNCDDKFDCPDRSDESDCQDSNGALGSIYKKILTIKSKHPAGREFLAPGKPDSCSFEQLDRAQCPCVFEDTRVIMCDNLSFDRIPDNLLPSVYKIRMSNNSIDNIDHVKWPKSLSTLVLPYNNISHISKGTFSSTPNLSKLYLSHNQISYIHRDAFAGLRKLTSLQIESNQLRTFDPRILSDSPDITLLYLNENMIDLPNETTFRHLQRCERLFLDHNRISVIRRHWFSEMTRLNWLSLSHNEISYIEDYAFNWDYELEELNLSFNKIKSINRLIFAEALNIRKLYLDANPFTSLPQDAFREVVRLASLNLTQIKFKHISRETFAVLKDLDFIYFETFRYCHYAFHVRVCQPTTDGLSTSEELLAFPILKYAVWLVASVCSVGNILVLIWRSISPHEDSTLSMFVKNLSIADLMMGIYLGAIGYQNKHFELSFGRNAVDWMSSWTCTSLGFLAIMSSELSVFIITMITIERYRSIMSIRKYEPEARKQRARVLLCLAWLLSFLIAAYPLAEWLLQNSDYYATNGLCLPLHIHDHPFAPGWQYSALIYLGINFSAVMLIIVLYARMYQTIMDNRQATRPALFKAEKREDAILAIRFFFIVITDCLCWIPIVVIKVIALAHVSIPSSIYGWLVVFIIPINSALNPIVYTLAAPTSLQATVCRLFERLCYKIDQIAAGGSRYSSQSSSTGSGASDLHESSTRGLVKRKKTNSTATNSTITDTLDRSTATITTTATNTSKISLESVLILNTGTTSDRSSSSVIYKDILAFPSPRTTLTRAMPRSKTPTDDTLAV